LRSSSARGPLLTRGKPDPAGDGKTG
jgi:hypothetical protein